MLLFLSVHFDGFFFCFCHNTKIARVIPGLCFLVYAVDKGCVNHQRINNCHAVSCRIVNTTYAFGLMATACGKNSHHCESKKQLFHKFLNLVTQLQEINKHEVVFVELERTLVYFINYIRNGENICPDITTIKRIESLHILFKLIAYVEIDPANL